MSDQLIGGVVTVLTAIIGVAIIAVLVSGNAQTSNVLMSGGRAFAGALQAAEAPVSGSSFGGVNLPSFGTGIGGF